MKRYLLAGALVVLCIGLISAVLPASKKGNIQIYLLMGQSNMAGRGRITPQDEKHSHSRVLMLTQRGDWVVAKHPIHFDKPKVAGVGPGLNFGMAMANAHPQDTILLVPCAVGGTSIDKWAPRVYDKASNTYPFDDAVLRIKQAMSRGSISGVIWLQGEADSGKDVAISSYLDKLKALINTIRKEVGNDRLPWVVGELGRYRKRYLLFNQELNKLPSMMKYTAVVSSDSLWHKGDTTHFDASSANEYGDRFARKMLSLRAKINR